MVWIRFRYGSVQKRRALALVNRDADVANASCPGDVYVDHTYGRAADTHQQFKCENSFEDLIEPSEYDLFLVAF
jgi:hypothetical protein